MPPNSAGQVPGNHHPQYDFIINPNQPNRQQRFGAGAGRPLRILVVVGGIFILFVLIAVFKSFLNGTGTNWQDYIAVAQQQQQMLHLVNNANDKQTNDSLVDNFSATANLSISSDQSKLLGYMLSNGQKVKNNTLAAGINANLDTQLDNTESDTAYNQLYRQIMEQQLNSYLQQLQAAYTHTKGVDGRNMLDQAYQSGDLLLTQLKAIGN